MLEGSKVAGAEALKEQVTSVLSHPPQNLGEPLARITPPTPL